MAAVSLPAIAQTNAEQPRPTRYDREIQRQVAQDLQKKDELRGISADVEEGIVTLSGEVNLYIEKVNAEKRVRKVKNVDGVRNHIEVEGEEIPDADLRKSWRISSGTIALGTALSSTACLLRWKTEWLRSEAMSAIIRIATPQSLW